MAPPSGAAYVGDSVSDLPTMLLSRLPIVIGGDPALLDTARALGVTIRPLAAATVALATSAGLPPSGSTLYTANGWLEICAVLLPPPTNTIKGEGVPRVLIVAGSDSGGGAGIQADLKACEANGAFGTTAVTALTAQNTDGVQGVEPTPLDFVQMQMSSVLGDIGADALKTGMLPSAALAARIATAAATAGVVHGRALVVDPVLVTSSGFLLVPEKEVLPIARWLFPLAEVVTPNLPEAECLLRSIGASPGKDDDTTQNGYAISTLAGMHRAAKQLHALGSRWVLLKGGHMEGGHESVDVLYGGDGESFELRAPRIVTANTHGTGCTLASTVAALLARGHSAVRAASLAKQYLHGALQSSAPLQIGEGAHGPLHHSYMAHSWPPPPVTALRRQGGHVASTTGATRWGGLARSALDLSCYVITDTRLNAKHSRSLGEAVRLAIAGGATIIQVREKETTGKELVLNAREAVSAAKGSNVPVLINDRVDVRAVSI